MAELSSIRLYSDAVSGVGASRRERGAYQRLPLQVAQFICRDQPPILWANFPCHPTVLGRRHTRISPELHGTASQRSVSTHPDGGQLSDGIFIHFVHEALSGNGEETGCGGDLSAGLRQGIEDQLLFDGLQLLRQGFGRI